ncbi:hypothetical protein L1049_019093 [Liquidambar formosana]|uniref:Peptidase A1 domain-containing protein n=1 Tax=Liquidambar formosana TaxID=63359 RepID=A0AAP0RB19_LIQFO
MQCNVPHILCLSRVMALFSPVFALAVTVSVVLSLSPLTTSLTEATNGAGFVVDLIHRDSPKSPLYNPSETPSQRLRNALQRSINRVNRFKPKRASLSVSPNTVQSEIIPDNGEYLMNISIGTPPFEVLAIADTGSDLIWTQCKPCTQCYKQKAPLFDPQDSSTYREISCSSRTCQSIGGASCDVSNDTCQYSASYGDQSFTNGVVAVDTVTLGSTSGRPVSLLNTIFGCGHNNGGTFGANGSGIVGLGGGLVSLITQTDSIIHGKFSYCLVPFASRSTKTSQINFGSKGIVSGEDVVTTPLVSKTPETFYYLTLEAISVGNVRLEFDDPSSPFNASSEGNIIIDSGTTLTLLPQGLYQRLESAVVKKIPARRVDDPGQFLSLCYEADGESDIDPPTLTMHFTGADVKLQDFNTFIRVSPGTVCFAFAPNQELSIYGNVAQMNFLVGYDLEKRTVSFKPTDCAS